MATVTTSAATAQAPDWNLWAADRPPLPPAARAALRRAVGRPSPLPLADLAAARVAPSRLRPEAAAALRAGAGAGAVFTDDATRARHAGGQSLRDLLRRRAGDASEAPDAVVAVPHREAVAAVLEVAGHHRLAVVPWGGGTSVVGGLDAERGDLDAVVALDLSALDRLLAVDATSQTATFEPGIRTPAAEAALAAHGLTLGHLPQSYERASLGGYVVTRSAGQASSGVGRIDDLVVGLRLATPAGELVLPALPSSAAGPDLRRLVLGSEGTLGILTEVTLRVRPLPAVTAYEAWVVPDWSSGVAALRRLAQAGRLPHVLRLSDETETRTSLLLGATPRWQRLALRARLAAGRIRGGCLVIAGWEGDRDEVRHGRRAVRRELRRSGAASIGSRAGESWRRHRFGGPAMRDTLLDTGFGVETLETAALWSRLDEVRTATVEALQGALPRALVGCHVSHLYPTGASLYFTVVWAAGPDPVAVIDQWDLAKSAASTAIVAAGGTISHHHAVGTMHRAYAGADLGGELGRRALQAVRSALDPAGVCNPGKLTG